MSWFLNPCNKMNHVHPYDEFCLKGFEYIGDFNSISNTQLDGKQIKNMCHSIGNDADDVVIKAPDVLLKVLLNLEYTKN